jgi:hypothetical protein
MISRLILGFCVLLAVALFIGFILKVFVHAF